MEDCENFGRNEMDDCSGPLLAGVGGGCRQDMDERIKEPRANGRLGTKCPDDDKIA